MTEEIWHKLETIPEPANKSDILGLSADVPPETALIWGEGAHSYTCGTCGHKLIRQVAYKQIQGVIFQCRCGAFNRMPASHYGN